MQCNEEYLGGGMPKGSILIFALDRRRRGREKGDEFSSFTEGDMAKQREMQMLLSFRCGYHHVEFAWFVPLLVEWSERIRD